MNDTTEQTRRPIEGLADSGQSVAKPRQDPQRRKNGQDALLPRSSILPVLLESASDGIVIAGVDGDLLLVNAGVEKLFGYDRKELLGQPVEILLPSRLRETHVEHRQDYFSQPRTRPMGVGVQLVGRRKDGSEFPVEVSLSYVETERHRLVMGFIVDISERVEAEETLRRYSAELEARNEELDAFAHTVAHDLKVPLTNICGYAEILEEDFTSLPAEKAALYINKVAQNASKMNNIVNELLLLASVHKIEELEISALDMAGIVTEARERLAALIEAHEAEIVAPPAEAWPVAQGYSPWIEQVWVNLLSNAIQYGGKPARIKLGFDVLDSDKDSISPGAGHVVRFWVRDNGPGLTPAEQAQVFAPFTRLDHVKVQGHGLGLSIVRRIVEKLGGQVSVESQIGEGSLFTFTLPRART